MGTAYLLTRDIEKRVTASFLGVRDAVSNLQYLLHCYCCGLKSTLGREVEGSRKKEIVFILKLQYISLSLSLSLTDITALLGP